MSAEQLVVSPVYLHWHVRLASLPPTESQGWTLLGLAVVQVSNGLTEIRVSLSSLFTKLYPSSLIFLHLPSLVSGKDI